MYTFHAWIILAETTEEDDVGGLSEKIEKLRTCIRDKIPGLSGTPVFQIKYHWLFQCSESYNRRGTVHDRLTEVLEWIAEALPGSYGLVYSRDDELLNESDANTFHVQVVARGAVTSHSDPFLSPIIPTIEDPL